MSRTKCEEVGKKMESDNRGNRQPARQTDTYCTDVRNIKTDETLYEVFKMAEPVWRR